MKLWIRSLYCALLGLCLIPGKAFAQVEISAMPTAKRAQIEIMLTQELQHRLSTAKRITGQAGNVGLKVSLDARSGMLIIDLSKEYVPYGAQHITAEIEDSTTQLANTASELLRGVVQLNGVLIHIDGKDIDKYFEDKEIVKPISAKSTLITGAAGKVVVSAGHGIYYHYGFNDWRAQRDPSNGITEDFITPGYATELHNLLVQRSDASVYLARSIGTHSHMPSDEAWWKLGARYSLQEAYPQVRGIWLSYPKSTEALRERNDDIMSRPKYANHLGANTLIHLHTNAADPSATGVRAIYHAGRHADQRLANNILCYMKELIRAKEIYAGYTVPLQAEARNNLAENSKAAMPSVIVEVGFHTNPSDAMALQDPVLRAASMKGVEKGYRLNVEGKTVCEPFKIESIPSASGPHNSSFPLSFNYKGYPQFPVRAKMENVNCPSGSTCTGGEVTYETKIPSPLLATFSCSGDGPPRTSKWRTILTDADEVKATPVEYSVTCGSGSGGQILNSAFNGKRPAASMRTN